MAAARDRENTERLKPGEFRSGRRLVEFFYDEPGPARVALVHDHAGAKVGATWSLLRASKQLGMSGVKSGFCHCSLKCSRRGGGSGTPRQAPTRPVLLPSSLRAQAIWARADSTRTRTVCSPPRRWPICSFSAIDSAAPDRRSLPPRRWQDTADDQQGQKRLIGMSIQFVVVLTGPDPA
jgi:hypothetical protein